MAKKTKGKPGEEPPAALTKEQTAKELGVSTRAVARYSASGRLHPQYQPKQHGGQRALYDRAEVERLKQQMQAPPAPAPKAIARRDTGTERAEKRLVRVADLHGFPELARLLLAQQVRNRLMVAPESKLILSTTEAAALAGLSAARIRAACAEGRLPAQRDHLGRGWRIKRKDLERWVERL